MREIHADEARQRGCSWCRDFQKRRYRFSIKRVCIHDNCPYGELEEFKSYNEFFRSKGGLKWLTDKK